MTDLGKRAVQVVEELTAVPLGSGNDYLGEAESESTAIDVELIRVLASEPFELSDAAKEVVARAHQN
ncbi:hypothetical protein B5D80_16515 [Micromonospora wenchangensis]|uniref:Uncharacterized protein n=1 Tax=Micromonospora wenchangensis TaxID=1185415 RepID=A0A246RKX0_9ACTN|nr:hypothetical protein [Micromonospora wenchangensis]OWV06295.1 hypothetical protein B5D80_16515 [Micromonospora wenchangensis]